MVNTREYRSASRIVSSLPPKDQGDVRDARSECDATRGSLSGSVISRAPRSNVKYDHAHWIMTTRRLRNPIRKRMWTNSQSSQAKMPGRLDRPDLGDGGTAADRGQHSFVDIMERQPRLAAQRAHDVLRGVPALLHRGGGDARHESAVVLDVGQVADHVDIVVAGDGQLGLDHDAAGPVERHTERLRQRRGGDARGPDDRVSMDPLAPDPDPFGVDPVTWTPVQTVTPSFSSCWRAASERSSV